MTRVWGVLIAILVLAWPSTTLTWGGRGHRLLAAVAETYLNDEGRKFVIDLLGINGLVAFSSWAERDCSTAGAPCTIHAVRIPLTAGRFESSRDCAGGACAVAVFEGNLRLLSERTADGAARRDALKRLVHAVGDLHQPLRASLPDGTNTMVAGTGLQTLSVFDLWERTLPNMRGLSERQHVQLLRDLAASQTEPSSLDPVKWVEEAHQVASRVALAPGGKTSTSTMAIDIAYLKSAQTAIDLQLARGGRRLAAVLNAIPRRQTAPAARSGRLH